MCVRSSVHAEAFLIGLPSTSSLVLWPVTAASNMFFVCAGYNALSALMLLVGRQEGPVKTE